MPSKFFNLDTDSDFTANSDYYIPSQKAVKSALDKKANIEDLQNIPTLPEQSGNENKALVTDGANASWQSIIVIKDWRK